MKKNELKFKEKIEGEFPGIKIKTLKSVTTGWCNHVIIVNSKIVFRFPKDRDAERRLMLESRILDFYRGKVDVDIPDYEYMPLSGKFAGYRKIAGSELDERFIKRLNREERNALTDSLADFISTIHSTKKSHVKHLKIPFDNGKAISRETAEKVRRRVFPLLKKKDVETIERFIPEMLDTMAEMKGYGYTHNDLRGNHIFFDRRKGRLGVIDFGDFAWFEKAKDFSELLSLGEDFAHEVFEKYKCSKKTDLMKRARIIYKRLGLVLMYESLEGYPMPFKEAYGFFRKRFYG
ncbi:MAG: aminoglycoside phosphotransferase family protein [bacterium]|nr:aminoglycoside phosphotransferase family protein [bacterium]